MGGESNVVCDGEDSPFDLFVKASTNMTGVWENILESMSETDVARCMKVSKTLRHVIGQCIVSNSSLCRKMDNAACASALIRSSFLSKTTCKFQRKLARDLDIRHCQTRALDHTWYYQNRITGRINIQRFGTDTGTMTEAVYEGGQNMKPVFNVFPTMNPDKAIIGLGKQELMLFNHASGQGEKLSIENLPFGSPEKVWPFEKPALGSLEVCLSLSSSIKSMIFLVRMGGKLFQVVMAIAGSDGKFSQSVALYTKEDGFNHNHGLVKHQSSNEQVRKCFLCFKKYCSIII